MEVLCIGNSFTVDATRYLHQLARKAGETINTTVLYIGGCTLERHYRNMLGDKRDYTLYTNGNNTGFPMSLHEALLNRKWDVITIQQGSIHSAKADMYDPFAESLVEYIRECAPKAKLVIQQTWAYEEGSERLFKVGGYPTEAEMFADIEKAYELMFKKVGADDLIPSGKLMRMMKEAGIPSIHRDTLHVTFGLGRYALGLLWFNKLTGKSVAEDTYDDWDEPVTAEEVAIAKACVAKLTQ